MAKESGEDRPDYMKAFDRFPEKVKRAYLDCVPEVFSLPDNRRDTPQRFNEWAEKNDIPFRIEEEPFFSHRRLDAPEEYPQYGKSRLGEACRKIRHTRVLSHAAVTRDHHTDGLGYDMIVVDDLDADEVKKVWEDILPPGKWVNVDLSPEDKTNIKIHGKRNKYIWKYLMENSEKTNEHINIQAEDGQVEIIHRYGAASEIQEPVRIDIRGSIEAPGDYFTQRVEEEMIDTKKAILKVNQNKGVITLNCDPSSSLGAYVVGTMKVNPLLSILEINNFTGGPVPEDEFILRLKRTRSIFADQKACLNIVDKIKNLEMKVERNIDRKDDERGSRKMLYEQACESDLPAGFELQTNIFVGSKEGAVEHTFSVELKFHYNSQLMFWLESPEYEEIYNDTLDKMMAAQLEKFEGQIPIIYV